MPVSQARPLSRAEVPRIYGIADASLLEPETLSAGAVEIARAGVRWVQLRAKKLSDEEQYEEIERALRLLARKGIALWINDRPDLATLFPVAGVHLGQDDLPASAARAVAGPEMWIGQSTHNEMQLRRAAEDPEVDLIAVGPIFPTRTKENPDLVVGTELIELARRLTDKPVVAVGGIDASNLKEPLGSGADSVAVAGALCRGDIGANCRRLLEASESRA
jgi:thiamine-phosphate pyrophosphorylase